MGIAKQGNDCEDIQHSTPNGKSQDTIFDTLFHMWIIVMIYLVCKGPIQNEVECFRIDYKPEVASVQEYYVIPVSINVFASIE